MSALPFFAATDSSASSVARLLVAAFLLGLWSSCAPAISRPSSAEECPSDVPADMACIPGGRFLLGSNETDWKKENWDLSSFAEHTVELSTFLLDKYEVTTEQYQACVAAGRCERRRT